LFFVVFFNGLAQKKQRTPPPPRRMYTRMATKTNVSLHVQGQM